MERSEADHPAYMVSKWADPSQPVYLSCGHLLTTHSWARTGLQEYGADELSRRPALPRRFQVVGASLST